MRNRENARVTRVYLVTLMPDPRTTYEPFFVVLSYPASEAARLDPRSSRATSQAFRAAVEIERTKHRTPAHRHLLCHSSRFVNEWRSSAPAVGRGGGSRPTAPTPTSLGRPMGGVRHAG